MRKVLGMSLVVVLGLGVGSYALGHGKSARDRTWLTCDEATLRGGMNS
jgi:hypothetical protein